MPEITERLSGALADRYKIIRHLGEGGMATVYLAEDIKHKRNVALKVLRPELAAVLGAERFVQEIQTTAALQHPHILPLFDSGEADTFLYYVMPFIDGETLRDKLNRETQLGVDEATRITCEIADALDYAHRQGIIHRDIKPENILLHDGRPMVADFGIALAVSAAAGGRMTETGLSLGTPHYMSPEQATADKEITNRSDIYSLGSMMYEMLTGDPPHTGSSAQAIIMKIVTEDAQPVTKLRKSVPPHIAAALAKSVEKLPADRFGTANEFAAALRNPAFSTATLDSGKSDRPRDHAVGKRSVAVGVALALLALAAAAGWMRPRQAEPEVARFRIQLWNDAGADASGLRVVSSDGRTRGHRAAIAPDGSAIVYRDRGIEGAQLYLKRLGDDISTPLADTERALSPFFSPDGRWIGFITESGSIKKVPSTGGGAVTLVERIGGGRYSAAWLDDGRIVYTDQGNVLASIPENGGAPTQLLDQDEAIVFALWPLPGSHGVLLVGCNVPCGSLGLSIYDFAGDSLIETGTQISDAPGVWYSPTGHLLYIGGNGGLFALEMDARTLDITPGAIPVQDGVVPWEFTISQSGDVLYGLGSASFGSSELVEVSRDGSMRSIDPDWLESFGYPDISPDGSALAVTINDDGVSHIWIKRFDGSRQKHTFEGGTNWRPDWLPDGSAVAFMRVQELNATGDNFNGDIWVRAADGSRPPELVLDLPEGIWEVEFTRDGDWMVFRTNDGGTDANIYARRTSGDTSIVTLVATRHAERGITLSPDARWIAYSSDESGQYEIYASSFPDMSARQFISRNGGSSPRWSDDGTEVFYRSSEGLMSAPVTSTNPLQFGEPTVLFATERMANNFNRRMYDVTSDGQSFIMLRSVVDGSEKHLVYVRNWTTELEAKLGI